MGGSVPSLPKIDPSMSANTTTANSRYASAGCSATETTQTFVDAVTDALADAGADEDLVETVADAGADVVEEVGELADTVDELREDVDDVTETVDQQPEIDVDEGDPIGSFRVDGAPLGRAVTSKASHTDVEERVEEAIDEIDPTEGGSGDTTPTPESGQSRVQTPLERVCGLPEHVAGDNLTANQERARFVAQGIKDYGRRVPAGIGIRSSEIRRVLRASEESTVHTQTVARVMDFLAELGGDDVRLKTTRSGERTVVFDEEIVDRITAVVTGEDGPPVIEEAI